MKWISPDPAWLLDGNNLYCYAKSNPPNFLDTNGKQSLPVVKAKRYENGQPTNPDGSQVTDQQISAWWTSDAEKKLVSTLAQSYEAHLREVDEFEAARQSRGERHFWEGRYQRLSIQTMVDDFNRTIKIYNMNTTDHVRRIREIFYQYWRFTSGQLDREMLLATAISGLAASIQFKGALLQQQLKAPIGTFSSSPSGSSENSSIPSGSEPPQAANAGKKPYTAPNVTSYKISDLESDPFKGIPFGDGQRLYGPFYRTDFLPVAAETGEFGGRGQNGSAGRGFPSAMAYTAGSGKLQGSSNPMRFFTLAKPSGGIQPTWYENTAPPETWPGEIDGDPAAFVRIYFPRSLINHK